MNIKGGVRRLSLEVAEWPEVVCMHSVLDEVAPHARQTKVLSGILSETETGATVEPPFKIAGDVATVVHIRLEQISVDASHIYAELAAQMLHGALAEPDRVPVAID